MSDREDFDDASTDPVPDQVGRHDREFAPAAGKEPASLRLVPQGHARLEQAQAVSLRRQGTELRDIGLDRPQLSQRSPRPDDFSQDYFSQASGIGDSSGVPQLNSHFPTAS